MEFEKPNIAFIRDKYSEEPCDALFSHELDNKAFVVATSYVPTLRVKKFKQDPNDTQGYIKPLNENNAVCYIDSDVANNKADYLMKHNSCEKNNDVFRDIDFIESVRETTISDRSQQFPFSKCVIEVNESKITDAKLNKFWNNVEKAECDALFLDIRKENKELQERIKNLRLSSDILQEKMSVQRKQINDNDDMINAITEDILQKDEKIKTMINNISILQKHILDLEKETDTFSKEYQKFIDDNISAIKSTNVRIETGSKQLEKLKRDLEVAERKVKELTQQYELLRISYADLYKTYEGLIVQKTSLTTEVQKQTDIFTTKSAIRDSCLKKLYECLAPMKINRESLYNEVTKCKDTQTKRNAEIRNLLQSIDQETYELRRQLLLEKEAYDADVKCSTVRTHRFNKTVELQKIIDEWNRTRKNCELYILQIKKLENEIQDILKWCQLDREDFRYFNEQYGKIIPKMVDYVDDACAIAPIFKPMTLHEYLIGCHSYSVRGDIKYYAGTFESPTMVNLPWQTLANRMWSVRNPGAFRGLVPQQAGVPTKTTFLTICTRFWVSKEVFGWIQGDSIDDVGYVYINGGIIARGNNRGGQINGGYTFKQYTGYRIVVIYANNEKTGNWLFKQGFEAVIPFLCYKPERPTGVPEPRWNSAEAKMIPKKPRDWDNFKG